MGRYSGQGTTVYAILLILIGFGLMALGWRGAAATLFIPTQVAYAVSGGLAGLGLIGTGAALLNIQADRIATAERSHRLDGVIRDTATVLGDLQDTERTS